MLFKSKQFHKTLQQNINSLWHDEEFCDVEIEVDEKIFRAHKLILSASSPYFQAMFKGNMCERHQAKISLHDISTSTFKTILDFIYSSEVVITEENVIELLSKASMLQMCDILEHCCHFLQENLDDSNCCGIYTFAEIHNCTKLMEASMLFIQDNFIKVSQEEEFCDMSRDFLKNIIASENLNIDNEYQVLQAAIKWVLKDPATRRKSIFTLLEEIRLPLIPEFELQQLIDNCSDLGLSVALQHTLRDVKIDKQLLYLEVRIHHHKKKQITPRLRARKNILVLGGYNQSAGQRWDESTSIASVEMLNIHESTWNTEAPMIHARSGHSSTVVDSKVYVFGGENQSMIIDSVEVYDPTLLSWTELDPMPMPRSQHSCCNCENKIYVFGGWIGPEITSKVDCFNPYTREWMSGGDLGEKRCGIGICCVEGIIYLIGGRSELGYDFNSLTSYNPITQKFTLLRPMSYSVSFCGVVTIGHNIYVVGGSRDRRCVKNVCCYSIKDNTWKNLSSLRSERSYSSVVVVNERVFVIGGRLIHYNNISIPSTLNTLEVYDPIRDSWDACEFPNMAVSRCEATAVVI